MIKIRHYRLHDYTTLRRDWNDLQTRSAATFFLSWHWMGCWLEIYRPDVTVIEARHNEVVCGLGLLVRRADTRHFLMKSKVLRLHQTGSLEQDQVWIEYNGWLTQKSDSEEICRLMSRYLREDIGDWDEFSIGAMEVGQARLIADSTALDWQERWSAPCFGVDLKVIKGEKIDYLSTISHNTRYQIRRSERHYRKFGPVLLRRPVSTIQALEWFDDIAPLHMRRWGSSLGQSGFANPQFVDFHKYLIEQCWAEGHVDLIALYAGDTHVATFYNLIYNNRVYFYLSGIQSVSDNKQNPGLPGHSMCIEHYMKQGYDFYDFMGGNERYKKQLGTWHNNLVQVSLQKRRIKFQLESLGRMIKRLMRRPVELQGQTHD